MWMVHFTGKLWFHSTRCGGFEVCHWGLEPLIQQILLLHPVHLGNIVTVMLSPTSQVLLPCIVSKNYLCLDRILLLCLPTFLLVLLTESGFVEVCHSHSHSHRVFSSEGEWTILMLSCPASQCRPNGGHWCQQPRAPPTTPTNPCPNPANDTDTRVNSWILTTSAVPTRRLTLRQLMPPAHRLAGVMSSGMAHFVEV
jgi:hypothetical protein